MFRKETTAGDASARRFLIWSLIAAFLAECSISSGLLLWPVLSAGAWILRLSRRVQLVVGCVGALASAVFLYGWHPVGPTGLLNSLSNPLGVAHFLIFMFGASWQQIHPGLIGLMGSAGLLLMAAFCLWVLIRRPPDLFLTYCALLGGFLLAAGLITALGRVQMVSYSTSRYQTPVMLFWWVLLAAAVGRWMKTDNPSRFVPAAALVTGVFLTATTTFGAVLENCEARSALLETGRLAIQLDVRDDQFVSLLYPDPTLPYNGYRLLWQQGLALPGRDPWWNIGDRFSSMYRVAPRDTCAGGVNTQSTIGNTQVATGWAWDWKSRQGPVGILFVDANDIIAGMGEAGLPRPDIRSALEIPRTNLGWHGFVRLQNQPLRVRAFAIMSDHQSVCDVGVVTGPALALSATQVVTR